jgi:hypothetical protein
MAPPHIEYIGFHNSEATRDYLLFVRQPDGRCDEFVLTIEQAAFVSGRVRYQDGAEICFLKLSRVLAAWAAAPESGPPASRQGVTEADLVAYREAHSPKVKTWQSPRPAPVAR